jgi:hypothetical protein
MAADIIINNFTLSYKEFTFLSWFSLKAYLLKHIVLLDLIKLF